MRLWTIVRTFLTMALCACASPQDAPSDDFDPWEFDDSSSEKADSVRAACDGKCERRSLLSRDVLDGNAGIIEYRGRVRFISDRFTVTGDESIELTAEVGWHKEFVGNAIVGAVYNINSNVVTSIYLKRIDRTEDGREQWRRVASTTSDEEYQGVLTEILEPGEYQLGFLAHGPPVDSDDEDDQQHTVFSLLCDGERCNGILEASN